MKKLNEIKIYDNLNQIEKARLLFKAMKTQDGNTFDKLLSSGDQQRWVVRNHEARIFLDNMVILALSWGVAYWKNQSSIGGNVALTQTKDDTRANEALINFKEHLILNEAYLILLDRLENDYGLSKQSILTLANVSPETSASKEFAEIMPNDTDLLEHAVTALYEQYSQMLDTGEQQRTITA